DLIAVGGGLAWIIPHSGIDKAEGSTGAFDHARLILDAGLDVFARSAWPWGPVTTGAVWALLAAIAAAALVVQHLLPTVDPARTELRRWLAVAAGGVITAAIAWAIFIPSHPYYTPVLEGLANRVNVLAAIGIIIALYSVAMLAGIMAFRGLPRAPLAGI